VARLSRKLATSLSKAFDSNAAEGYHEALAAAFCDREPGCSRAPLPRAAVGTLFLGGERVPRSMSKAGSQWRRRPKDDEFTLPFAAELGGAPLEGRRLYHPAKCAADSELGSHALDFAAGRGPCFRFKCMDM